MTTQRRSVRRAINELVRRNPNLSQRGILSELRSQGLRISNLSGRSIINDSRVEIAREAEELARQLSDIPIARIQAKGEFLEFTLRERDLRGLSKDVVERRLRENIRNREVFVRRRNQQTRLSDFSHVVVGYRATATIAIYIEGRLYSKETRTLEGQYTSDVTQFTEELLAERVRQQVSGIITTQFSMIEGLGVNSIIDGLTIELENLQVSITSLTPRGSRARQRG